MEKSVTGADRNQCNEKKKFSTCAVDRQLAS